MSNFAIDFSNPWLLLLLVPALALTLLPYLRMNKHYRRNRNRIISMVLHMVVMFLCVSTLAGLTFEYDTPNRDNEIILLVDSSFSGRDAIEQREDFIQTVIGDCGDEFKLGIVKFGYDQKYVAELSNDTKNMYRKYLGSADPDTSATDIASALKFASGLFSNPLTAKIVLISDGVETDGKAASVIKGIAAQGTKVDVICFVGAEKDEVQIMDVVTPANNVDVGMPVNLIVKLHSNFGGDNRKLSLTLYDNDTPAQPVVFDTTKGDTTVNITYAFTDGGLHELHFVLTDANGGDTVSQNNEYYTYVNIANHENILLIEKEQDESEKLVAELEAQGYKVDVKTIDNADSLGTIPKTIGELAAYEQVVLVNIANADMPAGFDKNLYDYVNNLGGGLLTVGGRNDVDSEGKIVPHAYNREDMANSYYQQLLPVQAVQYTPPTAVLLALDTSGSIGSDKIRYIKEGAQACLRKLNPWDYCGILIFDSNSTELLPVTPVTEREKISKKIDEIGNGNGSTTFSEAIINAGQMLASVNNVARKHVILVSDCKAGDIISDESGQKTPFVDAAKLNFENGITLSIVGIEDPGGYGSKMEEAVEAGGGKFYWTADSKVVGNLMLDDLVNEAVGEIEYGEEFTLKLGKELSSLSESTIVGVTQEELDKIIFTGYYGTRLKDGAEAPLMAQYVPMYAQWTCGDGKVGSFMCDLNGTWSGEFLDKPVGMTFIKNVVTGLFPADGIKQPDMNVVMREDNYTTQLNVYAQLDDGETIDVKVVPVSTAASEYFGDRDIKVTAADGYTRFTFATPAPGLYNISVEKKDAYGNTISVYTLRRTLAYSKEYDVFTERDKTGEEFLAEIAKNGKGVVIEDALQIFQSFVRTLHKVVDPRIAFLIIAIILFLLDIAVRKFKFKWIHEILRDRKAKKALEGETRKQGE